MTSGNNCFYQIQRYNELVNRWRDSGRHIILDADTFEYDKNSKHITIEKGSITINGVSLTVVNSEKYQFSVAIIPYTYKHTSFQNLENGNDVNLEFDILGKCKTHVKKLLERVLACSMT